MNTFLVRIVIWFEGKLLPIVETMLALSSGASSSSSSIPSPLISSILTSSSVDGCGVNVTAVNDGWIVTFAAVSVGNIGAGAIVGGVGHGLFGAGRSRLRLLLKGFWLVNELRLDLNRLIQVGKPMETDGKPNFIGFKSHRWAQVAKWYKTRLSRPLYTLDSI